MGTIQIKKYERTVTIGKGNEQRQKVQKTYGKIIYCGTLNLNDMAEHIMKEHRGSGMKCNRGRYKKSGEPLGQPLWEY